MASNLAIWAIYSSVSVSVATGVGVATGIIPADILNRFTATQEQPQSVALAPPTQQPQAVEPVEVEPEAVEPQAAAPVLPEFDILRLEEDGSALVAGRAEGDSVVELVMPDGTVLGTTRSGPGGDFVILPDDLLPPGDYALTLRSTREGGEPQLSEQTGILRIPEADGGERLAMIAQDGQASRIMVKPEVLQKAEIQSEPEKVEPAEAEPVVPVEETVETPPVEEPTNEVAKAQVPEPIVEPEPNAEEVAEPEVVAIPVPQKPEAQSAPKVLVEAVELENGQIFIAGAVKQGARVRIYIDNKLVGMARGTADNRFLLQRNFELTPGNHSVRADVVNPATGDVLARAEVPLIHNPQPVVEVAVAPKPEPEPAPEPVVPAKVASQPETAQPEETAPAQPVVSEPAEEPEATEIEAVEAAPALRDPEAIHTGRSIIILPGDNLWQISRKTYGKGIRYTTIYNANKDQIRDPNRIYVGQIFKLPESAVQ